MRLEALSFGYDQSLKSNLARLKLLLRANGINACDAAESSIELFGQASLERQKEILKNISIYLQILSETPETPNSLPTRNTEVARLKKALGAFGLRPTDESFFDLIKSNDVVEVYSSSGVQLYRNVLFCKICSYSVLDLAVNPWDVLYEKPTSVVNHIHNMIQKIVAGPNTTLPFEIRPFVQKEKFIYAQTRRTYVVAPKFISAAIDIHSGKRTAFMITFEADIIAEGIASSSIDII